MATESATPFAENDAIDKRKDIDDKPKSSKFWLGEIAAAKKRDKPWAARAKKVVARYRDEREFERENAKGEKRANIFWSNTEILKASLFQGLGNPDVRRRFPKKGKDGRAARQAALVLERGLSTCMDLYDTDAQIEAAVEDCLIPGRGTAWIVYEAEVRKANPEADDADEGPEESEGKETIDLPPKKKQLSGGSYPNLPAGQGGLLGGAASKGMGPGAGLQDLAGEGEAPASPAQEPEGSAGVEEEVYNQLVRIDHVFWEDYLCSAGRKDSDVWWKARAHAYSRDELKKYWPDHADKIPLDMMVGGYQTHGKGKDQPDTFRRARVWEIWDKSKKQRIYVAEGYEAVLETEADPYKLKDFFPTVEPLYGVKNTSTLEPIPEYCLYQDQAEELDLVTTRLSRLINNLKRRGVYDAGADGTDGQLAQLAFADDDVFLPYRNFVMLMEKGGLKGVFQAEDLQPTVVVVEKLYQQRATLIQSIYEITGISDVIRGATDPNETATAQRIKGQFGSLRIQKRQRKVQTFIRDLFRLKAEIMAEHFTREQLQEMSGIMLPTRLEQQQAKQALLSIQQQMEQSQQSQQAFAQWQQQQQQAQQQPPNPMMGHNGGPPGPLPGAPGAAQGAPPQGVPPGPGPQMGSAPMPPGMPAGIPIPQPPPQVIPPPNVDPDQITLLMETAKAVAWEDIEDILRSDERRSYKVDVETDNTAAMESETEKQQRIEFLSTMQGFMERVIPMVMQAPQLASLAKETIMFALGGFKVGRTMEETFTDAFEQLENLAMKQMQSGPQPDPKVAAELKKIEAEIGLMQQKAQVDLKLIQEKAKADSAMAAQKVQQQAADTQAQVQQDQVKTQSTMAQEQMKLQTAQQTNALKMAEMAAKVQADQQKLKMDMAKSQFEMQAKKAQAQTDAWLQRQQQQHTERVQSQEMQLNERRHQQESEHAERDFHHQTARDDRLAQHKAAQGDAAVGQKMQHGEAQHRQQLQHREREGQQKVSHAERQARAREMLQARNRLH